MQKLKLLLVVPLVVGVLYGCNKNEVEQTPASSSIGQNDTQQVNGNTAEANVLSFTHFSLDVKYSATESYEVDYENEKSGLEAEIEDDRGNGKLRGDKAYAKLEPLLKQLTFDATTANDEVIDQVIAVFNIADDYQSIEVEVTFADGTEKEFQRIK